MKSFGLCGEDVQVKNLSVCMSVCLCVSDPAHNECFFGVFSQFERLSL